MKPYPSGATGQNTAANSLPVVLASNQDSIFDRTARHQTELSLLEEFNARSLAMKVKAHERVHTTDRRGHRGRGLTR